MDFFTRFFSSVLCVFSALAVVTPALLYADNFRDDFNVVSYNNNNGSRSWSGAWQEVGETTSPTAGAIRVAVASGLRIQNPSRGAYRELDLATDNYTEAVLKYTYRRNSLEDSEDAVNVQISNDGGNTWVTEKTYAGTGTGTTTDASPIADSIDIKNYIATNTRIRFIATSKLESDDQVYFDAIEVVATKADPVPVVPDLLAYYQADEFSWTGAAGEIADASGNGKNATALGGVNNLNTMSSGKICRAARVSNNTTDALQYAVNTGIDVDDDIGTEGHISFWYRPAPGTTWASGGNRTLFDASNGAPDNKIFFLTFISGGSGGINNGKLRFAIRDANGGELRVRMASAYAPAANAWVHIAVNWSLSAGAEIWLDGVKQTLLVEANTINNTTAVGELNSLYFGDNRSDYHGNPPLGSAVSYANSARGDIDEMRIYRGNLSADDIAADRDATHPCAAPVSTLLAHYKADEFSWTGAAGEIIDASGNNKHATALGGAANINTISAGKICYSSRILANATDALQYAINTPVDIDDDIGAEGHINFWYRPLPGTTWAGGGNRTLFDASKGAPDNKVFFLTFISGGTAAVNNGKLRFAMRDANGGELRVRMTNAYTPPANAWVHIAVNWSVGSGVEIWLDGVKQDLTIEANTINATLPGELDALYIGDNRTTYHPSGTANSARGDLDEIHIYRGVRTEAEITADRDATHPCTTEPSSLLAYYPMNESSWSGTTDVVLDKSGNNRNADVLGVNNLANGKACRGIGIPRNLPANAANTLQYAVNTKLDVDDEIGSRGHISFWYRPASGTKWINGGNRMLFDASRAAPDNRYFFLTFISGGTGNVNNGKLRFAMRDAAGGQLRVQTLNAYTPSDNAWVHVAVNWDVSAGAEIYLDGVKQTLDSNPANIIATLSAGALGELDSLYVGDNRSSYHPGGSGNSARGDIDELRIFHGVRTTDEIISDMGSLKNCLYLQLQSANSASTCVPLQLTINACTDVACNELATDYTGTVNLSTAPVNHGVWSKTASAQGALSTNTNNDDGVASYNFAAGDNGSATLQLENQRAESLTITGTDSVIVTATDTTASIEFSDNAFVITEDPLQVAGKPQVMQAALWQRDTTQTPADCAVAKAYAGNKTLKGWITRDVDDPAGIAPTITSVDLPSVAPAADNLTINFVEGVATFALDTTDVGKYSLNLRDDSRSFSTAADIVGASAVLTVRPFGFYLDAGTNSTASSASDEPAFKKAGETFDLTIKAVVWEPADDSDNDGIPDTNADLLLNAITPNFKNQTITLEHTLFLPSSGNVGIFSPTSFTISSAGTSTQSASFSEVGIIDIDAKLDSYLGSTIGVSGKLNHLGRFVPHHFTLTQGDLDNRSALACSPVSTFTYIGENLHQQFELQAENLSGVETKNYVGAFARLDANSELGLQFAHDGTDDLSDELTFSVPAPFVWADGKTTVDVDMALKRPVNDAAGFRGPYSAVVVAANPVDEDGVTVASAQDVDVTRDGTNDHWQVSSAPTSLLYGRLELLPAYGPENRNLPMTIRAMSFTANGWQVNELDNCTPYGSGLAADLSAFTDNLQMGETTGQFPAAVNLVSGQSTQASPFLMTAPGAGNDGSVQVTLSGLVNYLQYPWTHCAASSCGPQARASFGLYRGNDRVIYWQGR